MKTSIIIPWFDTVELVNKNLPAVLAAAQNPKNDVLEVIIVDDDSTDKSADEIKKNFPEVKLIRHKINRGFAAAVNTGVRAAKGKLICLLNSDVLPDNNFLEDVFKDFENPKVFGVSLNEKGEQGWAKGYFKSGFIEHESGGKTNNPHRTFWVSGGSGVFRREIWIALGGMDEKLYSPFYWEDMDICYRAMKRGYELLWVPLAEVAHEHETTIKKLHGGHVQSIQERNQLLFIWKNITSGQLTRKHIVGLMRRLVSHPGYIKIVLMALGKIGLVLRRRFREAKDSKISDEAILARFS